MGLLHEVAAALQKRGFSAQVFADCRQAEEWLLPQVPAGETIAFGGSVTLTQMDLRRKLTERGALYIDYRDTAMTEEELYQKRREVFFCHSYFSSANALTQDGLIVNVDGTGNRVAATIFGPRQVYFIVGRNKLVPDLQAAIERLENVATPQNCRRLQLNTPCAKTGHCAHCGANTSICRAFSVLQYAPNGARYQVLLIDEDLGY